MDLILKAKDSATVFFENKWLTFGALFCAAQASDLSIPGSRWGLDPSWTWTTTLASREMLFQSKSFIWTYGPLGFLDSIPNDWRLGFALSSIFAIFSTLFLFYSTYFASFKKSESIYKSIAVATLLTTYVGIVCPPSLRFIFGLTAILIYSRQENVINSNKYVLQFLALLATTLFYLKVFPFVLSLIIIAGFILREKNIRKVQDLIIFSGSLIIYLLTFAILLKFTISSFIFWVMGYFETLVGYKAMSSEQPGRKWEYFAAAILIAYILYSAKKNLQSRILFVTLALMALLVFTYGFTRHDGHSQITFCWLTYLTVLIFFSLRIRINNLIILIILFSSPLTVQELLDFGGRIQSGPLEVVKSLEPYYFEQKINSDREDLRQASGLSPQFLNLVQQQTISILPWDQLIAKGFGLNFVPFPIPQPYSAYTPKLDTINAKFVQSKSSPIFILLNGPKAIDGRNPLWESPLTNIAILCNYHTVLSDSEFLLLQKNKERVCNFSKGLEDGGSVKNSREYIEAVEVANPTDLNSKLLSVLFKQFGSEVLQVNLKDWNFVSKNRAHLILNVPPSLDYPGKWKIGNSNVITKSDNGIRREFIKVKTSK